jgi:hypothetical protein
MDYDFSKWAGATEALPWGAQKVLHDTLSLVAEGKVTLVHGADYSDGSPCLINAAATMLGSIGGVGGKGKPSAHYGPIVSEFDQINRHLVSVGVQSGNKVSEIAAEVMLAYFAPLKEKPVEAAVTEATQTAAFETATYREPSDEEMMRDFLSALSSDNCPSESDLDMVEEEDVDLHDILHDGRS